MSVYFHVFTQDQKATDLQGLSELDWRDNFSEDGVNAQNKALWLALGHEDVWFDTTGNLSVGTLCEVTTDNNNEVSKFCAEVSAHMMKLGQSLSFAAHTVQMCFEREEGRNEYREIAMYDIQYARAVLELLEYALRSALEGSAVSIRWS